MFALGAQLLALIPMLDLCAGLSWPQGQTVDAFSRGLSPNPSLRSHVHGLNTFSDMLALDQRIRLILDKHADFLTGFWDPALNSFSIRPNAARLSATSTSFSILSILENAETWIGIAGIDPSLKVCLPNVANALLDAPLRMDPFQTPIVMTALTRLGVLSNPLAKQKVLSAISAITANRVRRRKGTSQKLSAYLYYWNTYAILEVLNRAGTESCESSDVDIPDTLYEEMAIAVERAAEFSVNELLRQLALYFSGDLSNFDVIRLAYSLLTYYEATSSFRSFTHVHTRLSMKVITKALDVVFECQNEDGLWPKGQPIYMSTATQNSSRPESAGDIGNSYTFTFDLLSSMLFVFRHEPSVLKPYLKNFELALTWAESNVQVEVLAAYCDLDSRMTYRNVLSGWRSNHLTKDTDGGGPLAWCTAQVFTALSRLKRLVKSVLKDMVLAEFKGQRAGRPSSAQWDRLLDTDLTVMGSPSTLKKVLKEKILNPLQVPSDALRVMSLDRGNKPLYSAILFGPPGTAKTTVCQSLAAYLGWDVITIDTADFLSDGMIQVASRMTYIFDRLKVLEKTVILFDEIEEFCLNREDKSLAMESRMLTTAMLTQLNDLRRQQKSVFFVATNRLGSFDSAVTRPGRFDMVLFVGTPNLQSRLSRLEERFTSGGLSPELVTSSMKILAGVVTSMWDTDLKFFNFAENEALVSYWMEEARSGTLSDASATALVTTLSSSTTLRGAARLDYEEMSQMSRI